MSVPVNALCIVVRTAYAEFMGRVCTCVAHVPHPFGSHLFHFPNGDYAFGEPHNVRVIAPPGSAADVPVPALFEVEA